MTDPIRNEAWLDDLLAEGRAVQAVPDAALMARIIQDAAAQQARGGASLPVVPSPPAPVWGGWRAWLALLGGWPAVGGLVAATLAGVWIGAAPPAGLVPYTSQLWGDAVTVQLLPDADALGLEES